MESPLRPLQEALGAAFTEVAGVAVPLHYGDAGAEYRAVREAAGIVDRSDGARLRMWGRDPVKMLQGMITSDLSGAPGGRGVYGAMLTPKGRMIAELRVFSLPRPAGTELLIDLPREALAGAVEQLRKFVPPMFARWEVWEGMGALGVYGPAARELIARTVGGELPELAEDEMAEIAFGSEPVVAVGTRYAGGEPGYDLFVALPALAALWEALLAQGAGSGARPVGHDALETLRIEAGRPRYGHDLTAETIPTEAYETAGMMERAISFSKGCYTGQEVVVRIAHRGHVNRHLRGLRLGAATPPAAGTPLHRAEAEGREVGRVTSATISPRMGETIALAYLRREVEPGARVRLGSPEGPEAVVDTLPFRR